MAGNEKSSKELSSLAGKVLNDPKSTAASKKLAASVLTQAPDKTPPKKAPAKKAAPKAAPKKK